jgi:DedD protein
MPPDTDHDQELSLKKRARRRLVGAVGLVLLMVGVLPMVLQDRASLTPSAAIKITMAGVDAGVVEPIAPPAPLAAPVPSVVLPLAGDVSATSDSTAVAVNDSAASAVPTPIKPTEKPAEKALEKPLEAKPLEAKAQLAATAAVKAEDSAVTEPAKSSFAIQIGVYSSMASVTEMEAKLKQAGYQASIKKVSTDKGEKIRLRTGDYPTRQQAAQAMLKLQTLNMQGMVVTND